MQQNSADSIFKEEKRLRNNIIRSILIPAVLLVIPLAAMKATNEVDWKAGDFVFAYILLAGAGFAYTLMTKKVNNLKNRLLIGLAVFFLLAFVWAGAATGLQGV